MPWRVAVRAAKSRLVQARMGESAIDKRRVLGPDGAVMILSRLDPDERGQLEPLRPGRVVRDRASGSRGVVVQRDAVCARDEPWYLARQNRPRREQPWCQVLIDGGSSTGYFAAEALEAEPFARPIAHPLLHLYFTDFDGAGYTRNDRPWP